MSSGVAKRYARALFEIASERGLVDRIEAELTDIVGAFKESRDFERILMHPHIQPTAKKELVQELFQKQVAKETYDFLQVVVDNGRESELMLITTAYVQLANEARNIADGIVTTAKLLTDEELTDIAEQFGKSLNKTLRLQSVVDPAILGGIIVKIGDRLYDGSIKSKLQHFAHQL